MSFDIPLLDHTFNFSGAEATLAGIGGASAGIIGAALGMFGINPAAGMQTAIQMEQGVVHVGHEMLSNLSPSGPGPVAMNGPAVNHRG